MQMIPQTEREEDFYFEGLEAGFWLGRERMFREIDFIFQKEIKAAEAGLIKESKKPKELFADVIERYFRRKGGFILARDRRKNREKSKLAKLEDSKKSVYGHTDLTPYNVGRKDISLK